ncbi:acetate--CoA ligase family protein [Brumimicrobium oceani]|uniref:CoA ligase n=1 Tax=Brumimicrobium oceani TaxID=2100725 RepID=A0A2U2XBG9_9FLAO|nr:acetate--CoA ligase [Brumimicrobium oceani]PWH85100.1 CoA ligase [Brumimicrobium oceani]
MINSQLISPRNIIVVGASMNEQKPGGKVILNLLEGGFTGEIYALNKKPIDIQGVTHVEEVQNLTETVDLAILAVPAKVCVKIIKELIETGTKAFIIYSAGFSEAGEEGIQLEKELLALIENANASLIGPNCIGVINENYKGVFTSPIPEYDPQGCELISSSGATAVFFMEAAILNGLRFSNIYSIGNASHIGVEEVLEHMDQNFDPETSPKVKLLYLEQIKHPFKFLKHATSLIKKGCKIAAIKSGYSEAGGRAASSHTGALATSDTVVRALFQKAGIVYCSSREELIAVASVFQTKPLKGKNIAIITHAGGSAVMLTDALSSKGMQIPQLDAKDTAELLKQLHPGSSVDNPIDFLATGNAKQLGLIIDFCDQHPQIDGMVVVFGSPGLFNVKDVYEVLEEKMKSCKHPIYPVLPSVMNAKNEIQSFLKNGRVNFADEVVLGNALAHVYSMPKSDYFDVELPKMDIVSIRGIINASKNGFLNANDAADLMKAAGVPIAQQFTCKSSQELKTIQKSIQFPLVMKVVGPVHKTEVKGVRLNISSPAEMETAFEELMAIPKATSVLVQEMIKGEELFVGSIKQGEFGHLVIFGFGGIFLELLNDTVYALAPLEKHEVKNMIRSLKGYPIIEGYRGNPPLDEERFIDIIVRVGALVHIAPEILELDLNPLLATKNSVKAVDIRVRIEK